MSENVPNENAFKDAFRKLKIARAWRGTIDERKQKFQSVHDALNTAYNKNIKLVFEEVSAQFDKVQGASGESAYIPRLVPPRELSSLIGVTLPTIEEQIVLKRKLSVITFMQLWLRALGIDPFDAIAISKRIFTEIFPVSARKLVEINHLLVQQNATQDNDPQNDPINNNNGADFTAP